MAGNRVVIATATGSSSCRADLAALRARLVAVPVNPRSATGELVRMVADSGARLIVADATTVDPARAVVDRPARGAGGATRSSGPGRDPAWSSLDSPVAGGEVGFGALLAAEPSALPPARDPESLAVLLYTSGTSGRPRAAMLSHRALLANIEQAARVEPPMVTRDDVVYGVLPMFHVYGLNAVLGQVLRQRRHPGGRRRLRPEASLDDIVTSYGVTVLPVAPPVLAALARRRRPRRAARRRAHGDVRLGAAVAGAGGGVRRPLGVTVHQGYGLTEAAPVVTSTLCSTAGQAGLGRARRCPAWRSGCVDESGARRRADPGEILVRGDNLFDGYWPDGADGPDADGWCATGDVGFLDADGDLFLRRPAQGAHHRLRLQRLPDRDRGGPRRGRRGPGGGGGRRTGRG